MNQFPNKYDLGREEKITTCEASVSGTGVKVKKGKAKKQKLYPSTYIYEGPEGLAEAVRELSKEAGAGESFYVLAKIRPNRTTEEVTTNKDGETKERSSLEFDLLEICLPESVEAEDEESDQESSGDDNLDLNEAMDSAAKSLKIVRDTDDEE